jgi:predicted amidophosphoribosyltransferase
MERCPLCRATLNGAETCRRCRAELHSAIRVAHEGRRLAGAAIHYLSCGDARTAAHLLRRALAVHAAPEVRALSRLVTALQGQSGNDAHRTDVANDLDLRNM